MSKVPKAEPDNQGTSEIEGLPKADCANCGWYIIKKNGIWVHYADDERECSE